MVAYKKEKNSHYGYISITTFGHSSQPNQNKKIFFIVGILKAFWRCQIQINNMDKLIFVNKIGLLIPILVTSSLHIWPLYVKLNFTWQRSWMLNLWMKLNVNNF